MAKFKPGIPDSFTLDVAPVSDLGDYLDEPSPIPQRKPKAQVVEVGEGRGSPPEEVAKAAPLLEPEEHPTTKAPASTTPPVARQVSPPVPRRVAVPRPVIEAPPIELREERVIPETTRTPAPPAREPAVNEDRLPKAKTPRREISMTPETLRMSDELLEAIRSGSGQRDTKANELMHALVLLVHEAMDELDPHAIPKRGRWGSPTARAYPLELKNAFLHALLRKYREGAADVAGLAYAAGSRE